jgi:hypothetical protein
MSSTPNKPVGGTAGAILTALQESSSYVTLAIQVAGVLVPLGKSLIGKIKSIGQGAVTIEFDALVTEDLAELDAINQLSIDELAAINAELTRIGLPALPAAPPVVQSTDAPKS